MTATVPQVRAAMALVGWKQKHAARQIGTLSRGSVGEALCGGRTYLLARLQAALEGAGVEFIPGGCRLTSTAGA